MDQEGEQRGAGDDSRWPTADCTQNATDNWIEHSSVGYDAEIEDREYEHPGDRRDALDSGDDELRRVEPEPPQHRGDQRDRDQRHQR